MPPDAVRITRIPTGIAVAMQQECSQHQNRAKAMQMLKGRLYELEKCCPERLAAEASKTDIGWGHQIGSYMLQSYQMVKDLRSGEERSDPQKELNVDEFTAASVVARVGESEEGRGERIAWPPH